MDNKIILFQEKQVRRAWHGDEWWFVINDVIEILTDSVNAAEYFRKMLRRDKELEKGVVQSVLPLSVDTTRGKQKLKCANTKTVLRIIQSIPSPKAEPFKLWLAEVGYEHIQEIENPELGFERLKNIYRAKGYSEEWIEARLKSIDTRKQLTDEWKGRGVKEGLEYSILTAEISKATFGMTPSEYQKFKGLERQNLRDHMSDLELIFSMLGEVSTKMTAKEKDAQGFGANQNAAIEGGTAAGKALEVYENQSNRKVITPNNFLKQIEEAKKKPQLPKEEKPKKKK